MAFKQVQQRPKILLSYDTDDSKLPGIIQIILSQLQETLTDYEVFSSQDAYNNTKGLGAAMLNVYHVIMLETQRFCLTSAYQKEMNLAIVSNCNIIHVKLQDVEVVERFATEVEQKQQNEQQNEPQINVLLQYASNTSDNRLAFNEASYKAIFKMISSKNALDNRNLNKTSLIYISCSPKDKDYATKLLDFDKILKSNPTEGLSVKFCLRLGQHGNKISEEQAENEIFNPATVAVVLILTQNYLADNLCLKEAKFADCTRKLIIPTVWESLEYPPDGMSFLSKTYIDFSQISIFNKDKLNFRIQAIRKKAQEACNVVPFGNYTNTNFIIKNVGSWDEGDVSNWLRYIELNIYISKFQSQHVNGKVLLSLTKEDFAKDFKMQILHQKVIMTAIDALYDAINWNHIQVMNWLEQIELYDMRDILHIDTSINGKALLVLTDIELEHDYHVSSSATRKRLLDEIQLLKLQSAKVPIPEHYRYGLLKDIIKPVGADQHHIFRFHPDIKYIFADIIKRIEDPQFGVLQSGLHKFLFVISVLAHVYRNDFNKCKLLWIDANKVELSAIRNNYLKYFLMQQDELDRELGKKHTFLNIDGLYKIMQTITISLVQGRNDSFDPTLKRFLNWDKTVFKVLDLLDSKTQNPVYQSIQQIWLQYIFLENISNELFPIFDRNVNGYLTLSEILAGLDVILFGSTTDKIKMGLCIADEDHDNYLSPEELSRFYIKTFETPFKAIINSKLLPGFPTLRNGANHTLQSYIFEEIHEELDPTLPTCLNKELRLMHYGNNPDISEGDSVKKRSSRAILTAQRQPHIFSQKEIYVTFVLRKPATITNLYLGGAKEIKDAKYFKKAYIWVCRKQYTFNELKNADKDDSVIFFDVNLQEDQYHFAPEFAPIKQVEYVYIQLFSNGKATALEYFGIWGFVPNLPKNFAAHSTLELFVDAGGLAIEKPQVVTETSANMEDAIGQYFAMATTFADSGTVPDSVDKKDANLVATQLEDLTSAMPYVKPKKGNTNVNQVRMLKDLLPFIHLFMIFRGQTMQEILESTI